MSDSFKDRIIRHIGANGPLRMDEFMHWCMADPTNGYYQTATPFGATGDFITAPDISQMFGELIGIWCMQVWETLGKPARLNLIELGPGRGTLMSDLLRVAKTDSKFLGALNIVMVETSEQLAIAQKEKLSEFDLPITWLENTGALNTYPTLIIANEFLDVLPIRQFVKQEGKWGERCIGLGESNDITFVMGAGGIDPALLPNGHEREGNGAVFEYSPSRQVYTEQIANLITTNTGAALFIDYGHTVSGFGDTLQAMKNHSSIGILDDPGKSDITSHVDFEMVAKTATSAGCKVEGILTQGEFLLKLGLLERAGKLGAGKDTTIQESLKSQAERLALPDQMGDLFKCLCFSKGAGKLLPFSNS